MATVRAEQLAFEAFRATLLKDLPAKVASINASREATMEAPRAGPYTIPSGTTLSLSASHTLAMTSTALTAGSRTAAQVAAELAVAGLTASADSYGRLVLTSIYEPEEGTPSVVAVAPGSAAGLFGWDEGGERVVRHALVPPSGRGVSLRSAAVVDFGEGFHVLVTGRGTSPRSSNINDDMRIVTMRFDVLACEPGGDSKSSGEYADAAVRAVREVLLENRTLDGQVHVVHEVDTASDPGTLFKFPNPNGHSSLFTVTPVTIQIRVWERS